MEWLAQNAIEAIITVLVAQIVLGVIAYFKFVQATEFFTDKEFPGVVTNIHKRIGDIETKFDDFKKGVNEDFKEFKNRVLDEIRSFNIKFDKDVDDIQKALHEDSNRVRSELISVRETLHQHTLKQELIAKDLVINEQRAGRVDSELEKIRNRFDNESKRTG